MEIPSANTSNNQDNNRKMSMKIGGGGANIGGFILLGGALAAATFLGSAFAKSRKRRSNNNQQVQSLPESDLEKTDDNHTRNGLTLVLPYSSKNESADVESASPLPTHISVLEEKDNLQANGVLKELEFSQNREEFSIMSNISLDFTEDVKDNRSCDGIEGILESGEEIEAEDSSNRIPVENNRQDLETLEKGCESDSEIAEEETEEVIEETELHTNENQEVEEECRSDCNIIVKSDEEGFKGASVEVERQLIEDEEVICSIEASEVMTTEELIENEEIICSIEASEVKPTQELIEDEKTLCSIEESEVKPTQVPSLLTTDSVPENVNKDEEEFQHMQTEEEQELTRTDDQEAEQKDCLMEVFDHSPEVLESEDGNSNTEDGGLVLTEDSLEVESDECVVADTSNSDEGCDEIIQVSEEQEKLVVEIIEQVDSTEEDSAEKIVEGNQLIRLDDEEEETQGNDDKHIAVNGNEQLQYSEQEDGEDEESTDDNDDDDTSEKAEESSEGTGDSSMESNADAVWPVEKSTHEEPTKYLLDDPKIIKNNPSNEKNYLSKVSLLPVRVWILLCLAPLLLLFLLVHIFNPSFYSAPL
jgi:hypothetical protein